jgi:hypothetical protein
MKKGSEVDRTAIRTQNQSSQSPGLLKLTMLTATDISFHAIAFPTVEIQLHLLFGVSVVVATLRGFLN